ncbi:hypothetical protein GmHk_18G051939 [Glycine max]|nr:hypothetical protein GmHk_18G051939 [Glycine max]
MDEHQQNWKEMANTMMEINKELDEMFNITHVNNQHCDEVIRSFALRWKSELKPTWLLLHSSGNKHSVTYNQDMVTLNHYGKSVFLLTIFKSSSEPKAFPKWHSLYHQVPNILNFKVLMIEHKVNCSSLDVSSTMYSFMKAAGFTHLNLEGTECRIVYNHHTKTA